MKPTIATTVLAFSLAMTPGSLVAAPMSKAEVTEILSLKSPGPVSLEGISARDRGLLISLSKLLKEKYGSLLDGAQVIFTRIEDYGPVVYRMDFYNLKSAAVATGLCRILEVDPCVIEDGKGNTLVKGLEYGDDGLISMHEITNRGHEVIDHELPHRGTGPFDLDKLDQLPGYRNDSRLPLKLFDLALPRIRPEWVGMDLLARKDLPALRPAGSVQDWNALRVRKNLMPDIHVRADEGMRSPKHPKLAIEPPAINQPTPAEGEAAPPMLEQVPPASSDGSAVNKADEPQAALFVPATTQFLSKTGGPQLVPTPSRQALNTTTSVAAISLPDLKAIPAGVTMDTIAELVTPKEAVFVPGKGQVILNLATLSAIPKMELMDAPVEPSVELAAVEAPQTPATPGDVQKTERSEPVAPAPVELSMELPQKRPNAAVRLASLDLQKLPKARPSLAQIAPQAHRVAQAAPRLPAPAVRRMPFSLPVNVPYSIANEAQTEAPAAEPVQVADAKPLEMPRKRPADAGSHAPEMPDLAIATLSAPAPQLDAVPQSAVFTDQAPDAPKAAPAIALASNDAGVRILPKVTTTTPPPPVHYAAADLAIDVQVSGGRIGSKLPDRFAMVFSNPALEQPPHGSEPHVSVVPLDDTYARPMDLAGTGHPQLQKMPRLRPQNASQGIARQFASDTNAEPILTSPPVEAQMQGETAKARADKLMARLDGKMPVGKDGLVEVNPNEADAAETQASASGIRDASPKVGDMQKAPAPASPEAMNANQKQTLAILDQIARNGGTEITPTKPASANAQSAPTAAPPQAQRRPVAPQAQSTYVGDITSEVQPSSSMQAGGSTKTGSILDMDPTGRQVAPDPRDLMIELSYANSREEVKAKVEALKKFFPTVLLAKGRFFGAPVPGQPGRFVVGLAARDLEARDDLVWYMKQTKIPYAFRR